MSAAAVAVAVPASTAGSSTPTAAPAAAPPAISHKLPIYSQPEPEIHFEPDPSRLELEIRRVRLLATDQYLSARSQVRQGVERWIGVEQRVEKRIKSLKAKDESLTPGALYAGVAALTGSVIARNRALPVRVLLPPALLAGALPYFLPHTSANVGAYLRDLERAHAPGVAQTHDELARQSRETWEKTRAAVGSAGARARDGVQWAVAQTQQLTGLRLREAIGWAEKESKKEENVVKSAVVDTVKKETKETVAAAKKEAEEVRKAK
ncbi:hypothetical protein AURDEDRAFT_156258 [Auricularia subglabra TFB-10046 SS5]|nr:hypothetical protein AURDEDRAFT_156258 [Auricularia subglabra TFB-10046 SS5]